LAQDHKRLLDGDEGPNTGGMGVVAPVAMEASLRERIDREVLQPTMAEFKKRGFVYRGVLFVGIMMTEQGPSVLEFNTRFGDPETQAILPLLEERGDQDWGLVLRDLAHGELRSLTWKKMASCCVVLAAEGYPDSPVKGALISGLGVGSGSGLSVGAGAGAASGPGLSVGAGAAVGSGSGDGAGARAVGGDRYFLHAGTRLSDGKWQTSGGRVLGAMGLGANLREAVDRAYEQARSVCWDGIQLRSDIGAKVL
jgi:phosphoribosylamine--glycine ligase